MKLREKFESINPALKSFFRGKVAIVESGIIALLKLVVYNKSANSCSLADEFDYIVEREGKIKHTSFLNCVEVCDQLQLLQIIPALYHDLCEMKVDTLENYTVIYKHLNIQETDTTLGKEVLNLMCKDAAVGIKLQCGREYSFSCEDARATELHKLTEGQLKGLPTNNLFKFSRLAEVAKYHNYQFKAKGIPFTSQIKGKC